MWLKAPDPPGCNLAEIQAQNQNKNAGLELVLGETMVKKNSEGINSDHQTHENCTFPEDLSLLQQPGFPPVR